MPKVMEAQGLSVFVCDHGTIFVRLHDGNEAIFAAAVLNIEEAVPFAEELLDAINKAAVITLPHVGSA